MTIQDENVTRVLVTEHAVSRLKERHPEIFKAFGFNPTWKYRYGERFNENKILMLEILKRSNEAKSIMNNMSILIQMCDRHNMDIVNFRMFVFDKAIMLCEKSDKGELVIKTIADSEWSIARNVCKGDKGFDMQRINHPDMTLADMGEGKQLETYERILQNKQFASAKFFETGIPIGRDIIQRLEEERKQDKPLIVSDDSADIVVSEQEKLRESRKWVEKSINEHLQPLDLQMVCSNRNGEFIFFKPNCKNKDGEDLPAFFKLSHEQVFFLYHSDTDLKTTFQHAKRTLKERRELDTEDYILLLGKTLPDNQNGLQVPQRDLKDYLKSFLPEDIKAELKINNKMLQKSSLEHLFLSPQYSNMINQAYFSLFDVKRENMTNFMLIESGNDRNFYLAKNKLSGELMFVSYQVIDGEESPVSTPLNNGEHFAVLSAFSRKFSEMGDSEKETMGQAVPDENGDTLWQRIYRFGVGELSKYSHLRAMMDSVSKVVSRIPEKVQVLKQDEELIVQGDTGTVQIRKISHNIAVIHSPRP